MIQFAYQRGREAMHVFQAINALVSVTADWPHHLRMFLFSGDLETAFDRLSIELVVDSLKWWGIPEVLIAAIVEENSFQHVSVAFQNLDLGTPIEFNRCVRTGGKDSAFLWKVAFVYLLSPLVECWDAAKLGIRTARCTWSHVGWSDNIWLLAQSQEQLEKLVVSLTRVLHVYGLRWKPSSLVYFVANKDTGAPGDTIFFRVHDNDVPEWEVHEQRVLEIPYLPQFDLLGSVIRCDGKTTTSLRLALAKGTRKFFSMSAFFLSKFVGISSKFHAYVTKVRPVVLSGCCGWVWTQKHHDMVTAWENALLRRMHALKKRAKDTWLEWYKRTMRASKIAFVKRHPPIAVAWLYRLLSFGWRIATDKRKSKASVFVRDCIAFRDIRWWHHYKAEGEVIDVLNATAWRRETPGKPPIKWERPFVVCFGEDWLGALDAKNESEVSVKSLREQFVQAAYDGINKPVPVCVRAKAIEIRSRHDEKEERVVDPFSIPWETIPDAKFQLCVVGDNETVCDWWNSDVSVSGRFRVVADCVWNLCWKLWKCDVLPCNPIEGFFLHAQREHNSKADFLATRALRHKANWSRTHDHPPFVAQGCFVRSFSDGGSRLAQGGAGYYIEVAEKGCPENGDFSHKRLGNPSGCGERLKHELEWHCILETSLYIGSANSLRGEIIGSMQALFACYNLCTHGTISLDAQHYVQTADIDWHALVDILTLNSSRSSSSDCHERASMLHIYRKSTRIHCVI